MRSAEFEETNRTELSGANFATNEELLRQTESFGEYKCEFWELGLCFSLAVHNIIEKCRGRGDKLHK